MQHLAGPTVAVSPIGASRTSLTVGIVDTFFVRTTDNAVSHYDGFHAMSFDEPQDLAADGRIGSHITVLRKPTLHDARFGSLSGNDAHGDFCSATFVRTIKRDRRNRVSPKTTTSLFIER